MTVQHVVLFSFPRELSQDEAAQMRGMVASWPKEIGLMTKVRFGTDLSRARNRGYEYLLYTEFPDIDAMNTYRAHPVHVTFLNWLNERDCTPLAFDYQLDEQTVLMPELPPSQFPRGPPDGARGQPTRLAGLRGTKAWPRPVPT